MEPTEPISLRAVTPSGFAYGKARAADVVRTMLREMAGRLENTRPGDHLTEIGRLALIQATTRDPTITRALQAIVPEVIGSTSVVRKDFAAHGGSFPIVVKGTGQVGTITVSGLAGVDDHALVVRALTWYLKVDDVPL